MSLAALERRRLPTKRVTRLALMALLLVVADGQVNVPGNVLSAAQGQAGNALSAAQATTSTALVISHPSALPGEHSPFDSAQTYIRLFFDRVTHPVLTNRRTRCPKKFGSREASALIILETYPT